MIDIIFLISYSKIKEQVDKPFNSIIDSVSKRNKNKFK